MMPYHISPISCRQDIGADSRGMVVPPDISGDPIPGLSRMGNAENDGEIFARTESLFYLCDRKEERCHSSVGRAKD